jgi:hypothetical protein
MEKLQIMGGRYNNIFEISSKDLRCLLQGKQYYVTLRLTDNLDIPVMKEYMNQIKKTSEH